MQKCNNITPYLYYISLTAVDVHHAEFNADDLIGLTDEEDPTVKLSMVTAECKLALRSHHIKTPCTGNSGDSTRVGPMGLAIHQSKNNGSELVKPPTNCCVLLRQYDTKTATNTVVFGYFAFPLGYQLRCPVSS